MFEYLKIWNFQKHKKFQIKFDPHITTLTGMTEAGKSTILRALTYVCTNQPSGTEFVRFNKPHCKVILGVDGKQITRIRGKKINAYKLGKKKFVAFGNKVPSEIEQLLNLGTTNFQGQIDPPFWFLESAGKISKNLNAIVDLGAIDSSLTKAALIVRQNKNKLAISKERLEDAMNKKKELKWIIRVNKELKRVEKLQDKHKGTTIKLAAITKLTTEGQKLKQEAKIASEAIKEAKEVLSQGNKALAISDRLALLRKLLIQIKKQRKLSVMSIPNFKPIKKILDRADEVSEKRGGIEIILDDIKLHRNHVNSLEKDIQETETKLKKKLKGKCPTCGKNLSPLHAETCTLHSKPRNAEQKYGTGKRSRKNILIN